MINSPNIQTNNYKIQITGSLNKTYKELIKQAISITLHKEKIINPNLIIDIVICSEQQITEINNNHLNKNYPTDTISIITDNNKNSLNSKNKTILGSIFLCPKIIKQKAKDLNKDVSQHIIHLSIHSTLHLLGYNHESKEETTKMQNKEIQILSLFSITSPY